MWLFLLLALTDWTAVEQLIARGDYAGAQAQLERLPADSARRDVLASKIADGRNDPAAAVAAAESALKREPANEAAHVQLGSIFLSRNTPEAALEVFTEAQSVLPQSLLIRLGRGLSLKELQRWDEAEAELSRCLPHLLAYDALATVLIQRGRFADAGRLAAQLSERYPNDHRGWYFAAAAKDGQDAAGVEPDARKAIAINPNFAASHALLGKWLLRNDRLSEAVAELEHAARLRPDLVQAHLHLAQTYQKLDRKEDAAREFNTVRELKEKEKSPRQRLLFHRGASSPNR